jgi:hypothetical protein
VDSSHSGFERPPARLEPIDGSPSDPAIVIAAGAAVVIGRARSDAVFLIEDSKLSRRHVKLSFQGATGVVLVEDLESSNGTWVNGERVERAEMIEEDCLSIGRHSYVLRFESDDPGLASTIDGGQSGLLACLCEHCGISIALAELRDGRATQRAERYLCADCAVVIDFDSARFENYEILGKLGAGSAGSVFHARDLGGVREVALKILRPREEVNPRRVLRFVREANTAAALDHPHIVKVFGADQFPGGYYLVLEYFPGLDLFAWLKRSGRLENAQLLAVARQISCAIAHLAGRGVVHRDIKPANILYSEALGVYKLTDFGLARRAGEGRSRRSLTRRGEGLGTPTYMPPEQMNDARNVDERADIYAFGATLYHLATGALPIRATRYEEFLKELMERPPPPVLELAPQVPPALAAVIGRCMAKKQEQRFPNAEALRVAVALIGVA